jgi:hypothetical protein
MWPVTFAMLALAAYGHAHRSMMPTPAELTEAIATFTGKPVSPADVRRVSCKSFEEEPTEVGCKWQQRSGKRWLSYSTYVAIDARGWQLIDEPYPTR